MSRLLDLTGDKYGRLTVIKEVDRDKRNNRMWLCKCDCGNDVIANQKGLRSGNKKSCGCLRREQGQQWGLNIGEDLTGRKFGYLTVTGKSDNKDKDGRTLWICECRCGNIAEHVSDVLKKGNTTSCGCKLKKSAAAGRKSMEENFTIDGARISSLKSKTPTTNTTGVKGVALVNRRGKYKYRAYIGIKGKRIELGIFDTLEDAKKARKKAEKKYYQPYIDEFNNQEDNQDGHKKEH